MDGFGKRIRQLREEKQISRQDFCGDESKLSIRQLSRLEREESAPSLTTLAVISERLNLPLYYLMPDYHELPLRYRELKYMILRQPAYGMFEAIIQQESYLDEIFENYYDNLPADERLVVDYLQATTQLLLTRNLVFAQHIVEEGINHLWEQQYFTINDLSYLRLLALYFYQSARENKTLSPKYTLVFETTVIKLLKQMDFFSPDNLFVYVNTIFACLNYYNRIGNYALFPEAIAVLQEVLEKTHDYMKKPLIEMLEWKHQLFNEKDLSAAEGFYQRAYRIAQVFEIDAVVKGVVSEWEEDLEKFATMN